MMTLNWENILTKKFKANKFLKYFFVIYATL